MSFRIRGRDIGFVDEPQRALWSTFGIPDQFELMIEGELTRRVCKVAWRDSHCHDSVVERGTKHVRTYAFIIVSHIDASNLG